MLRSERNRKRGIRMAKVKITKELDSRNTQYFKLTKKRGKITVREAFEAMEESYYFGEYLIQFNVPEEAPMDLYEDGDEWRLYAVKELLEEELYKAHQEGYEECKKDFYLKKANNSWIPCSKELPEEHKLYDITFKNSTGIHSDSAIYNPYLKRWLWDADETELVENEVLAWAEKREPYRRKRCEDAKGDTEVD